MSEITLPHNWRPRPYQLPACTALDSGIKRIISIWHRRAGKDLTAINMCAKKSFERVGLYLHLLPYYKQGRKIVWNGMDKSGKPFLSAFPDEIIASKNDQEMTLKLTNGSIYQVAGTDNIDSLVGINPVGIILSEYSLQDPHAWDLLRPILAENEGWAWFIYTPRGRNHGYTLLERAKKNKNWFQQVLTVNDTNAIPLSAVDEERESGMTEELVQQEFFCSFDAPLSGAYYAKLMNDVLESGRIGIFPYDPLLPVDTFWDLGVGDSTAIWFLQHVKTPSGGEFRVIDYYESSGEGLLHYIKYLKDKPYIYEEHWGPHDLKVREFGSEARTRWEIALSHGLRFNIVPRYSVEDGIEAVRNILPRCYFNYDGKNEEMERGLEALRQYQKEWDDDRQCFKKKPLHDWTSHASDAFRYLAVAVREKFKPRPKRDSQAETEYDILGY